MKRFTIPLGRYVLAFALAIAVLVLPMAHLIAQVADSTAAGGAAGDAAASVGIFAVAGVALYQLLKFIIKPLDKLPAPIHMAIVYAANFLWQYAVPWVQGHIGVTLPGDLHQLGPVALAAAISALTWMGLHKLWQTVRDRLRAKGWWPNEPLPPAAVTA